MFFPFLFLLLLDPGSGMRKNQDPGETSRIRNSRAAVFLKAFLCKLTRDRIHLVESQGSFSNR